MVVLSQERAPLFEELIRFARQPLIPFHMPGHKAGRGLEPEWGFVKCLANMDLTEIPAFHWDSAWEEAEILAAKFFGADRTFFLTQGASQGIIGGILGIFAPGDRVLVGLYCHGAVIRGIILAGINPVFVESEFLTEFHIPVGIKLDSLRCRIREYPDCKGLIITNPSYQGVAGRLEVIRQIIGQRILMIDEAHGGHFRWMGLNGYNAQEFADIWVHGTHKILGSLTQTGMLHIKGGRIDPIQVKTKLALITTTSPSYILLASLDSNRRFLASRGSSLFLDNLARIRDYKNRMAGVEGLRVLTDTELVGPDKRVVDPWKISVHFQAPGITGYQADRILRDKYRIQSEYADLSQVTFMVAPWQREGELDELEKALRETASETASETALETALETAVNDGLRNQAQPAISGDFPKSIPPLMMTPRDAALGPGELVSLQKAAGRISADVIAAYPPGIPLVTPGELIRPCEIDYIQKIIAHKGLINGVDPRGMARVVR